MSNIWFPLLPPLICCSQVNSINFEYCNIAISQRTFKSCNWRFITAFTSIKLTYPAAASESIVSSASMLVRDELCEDVEGSLALKPQKKVIKYNKLTYINLLTSKDVCDFWN